MFDEEYVNIFVQIMPAFPRGSIVKLNNGQEAIVMKNYKSHIDSPDIRIIGTNEVIELSKNNALKIENIIQK